MRILVKINQRAMKNEKNRAHPVRIKLSRDVLLAKLANHYTPWGNFYWLSLAAVENQKYEGTQWASNSPTKLAIIYTTRGDFYLLSLVVAERPSSKNRTRYQYSVG